MSMSLLSSHITANSYDEKLVMLILGIANNCKTSIWLVAQHFKTIVILNVKWRNKVKHKNSTQEDKDVTF